MKRSLSKLFKAKKGATAIEYALIITLIAVGIIGGMRTLGNSLNNRFANTASTVTNPSR
jgi:pilus assembly protein Flp/PilA